MSSFTSSDAQPHPPDHQAHEPDWEIQSSSETDKIWSGLRGLRILGRRMTAEALGWRLLGDLHSQGIGTNEIEQDARKRWSQRMIKKGIPARESKCMAEERDPEYGKYQL